MKAKVDSVIGIVNNPLLPNSLQLPLGEIMSQEIALIFVQKNLCFGDFYPFNDDPCLMK